MNSPATFGVWLARYKGQNSRIHQLKDAFKQRAKEQNAKHSLFSHGDAVYSVLVTGDCLPDWGNDLLIECEKAWRGGREDLSAREQLSLLHKDAPFA